LAKFVRDFSSKIGMYLKSFVSVSLKFLIKYLYVAVLMR
jgi:hypothetical protein